jgi:elongator complex protein 3
MPSNSTILQFINDEEKEKLIEILRRKPTRTISGVNVVAVMTKPSLCPKNDPCVFCPGGLSFGTPQSYTGREPATLRGIQNNFDPYNQVVNRINQLRIIGHDVSKVELIVLGGTFTSLEYGYQSHFIKRCLEAINGVPSESFEDAKRLNGTSSIRNVGISVETRPDWAKEKESDRLIDLGVTRVELGVQTIYDKVYDHINRGHTVREVIDSTRILKDKGFKIVYHVMPNLFTTYKEDLNMFQKLFNDERFKPDALKIYPTLVLKDTKLYRMWKEDEYNPYSTEDIIDLLIEVKKIIPKWIRIQRIQRDIPSNLIIAGVKASNLRQIVQRELKTRGLKCNCIRCREVGHRLLKENISHEQIECNIKVSKERASEGEDVFISFEDSKNDLLIGYLRLRIPSEKSYGDKIFSKNCTIIRELHVFGPMIPVGEKRSSSWQHKGYGRKLITEAERISNDNYDSKKVVILSALGTKPYYMKFGYRHDGPYMSKIIS